jgi:hypothetical protein
VEKGGLHQAHRRRSAAVGRVTTCAHTGPLPRGSRGVAAAAGDRRRCREQYEETPSCLDLEPEELLSERARLAELVAGVLKL